MPAGLQWHYLDRAGQEFGPYEAQKMRDWFDQGHFEVAGDGLLVRLPTWSDHRRLSEIYRGDRASYFVAVPPEERERRQRDHRSRSPPPSRVYGYGDHSSGYGYGYPPKSSPSTSCPSPFEYQDGRGAVVPAPSYERGGPPAQGPGMPPHPPQPLSYHGYGYGPPAGHQPLYSYGPPPPHGYAAPPPHGYGPPPGALPCGAYGSPTTSHGYGPPPPGGLGYGGPRPPAPYGYGCGVPLSGSNYGPPASMRDGDREDKAWPSRQDGRQGKGKGPKAKGANVALNRQIINLSEAVVKGEKRLGELLSMIDGNINHMNEVNLSTAFHRVAKICRAEGQHAAEEVRHDMRFRQLQDKTRHALLDGLSWLDGESSRGEQRSKQVPMSVACVCWAHATLRLPDQSLFQEVSQRCSLSLGAFKNLELCNLLWAFAKLGEQGRSCKSLFKAAATEALRRPDDFSVVNFSTLAWSFATAKVRHAGLFRLVAEKVSASVAQAESQEIANTIWAFATAGVYESYAELSRLGDEAVRKLGTFKPQEAANVAWAFGRLEIPHPSFFEALEHRVRQAASKPQGLADFEPQHITMVLSSLASLTGSSVDEEEEDDDKPADDLADDIEDISPGEGRPSKKPRREGQGDPDVARIQALAVHLGKSLLPECLRQAARFKPEEASRVSSACSRLGLGSGPPDLAQMVDRFSDITGLRDKHGA